MNPISSYQGKERDILNKIFIESPESSSRSFMGTYSNVAPQYQDDTGHLSELHELFVLYNEDGTILVGGYFWDDWFRPDDQSSPYQVFGTWNVNEFDEYQKRNPDKFNEFQGFH